MNMTEEQIKKIKKREYDKAYKAKNKERIAARNAKYYQANQKTHAESMKKWRVGKEDDLAAYQKAYRTSVYYVYSHTNKAGDQYIGSGDRWRASDVRTRGKAWLALFGDGDCKIEILHKCKTLQEARELEKSSILEAGGNALTNNYKTK